MKRTTTTALSLALALLLGLALSPSRLPLSTAQAAPPSTPTQSLEQLCAGLTQANGATVQQVTTPELFARLRPDLEAATPGSLGTFSFAPNGYTLPRGNYASACLLRRQPDGVEDLVFVTLRMGPNNTWIVCGGPAGSTQANPLR